MSDSQLSNQVDQQVCFPIETLNLNVRSQFLNQFQNKLITPEALAQKIEAEGNNLGYVCGKVFRSIYDTFLPSKQCPNVSNSLCASEILLKTAEIQTLDTIKNLLLQGANPTLPNSKGQSLFAFMIEGYQSIRALVELNTMLTDDVMQCLKPYVNTQDLKTGETPLHIAVKNKNQFWIKILEDLGANWHIKDNKGKKPGEYDNTIMHRIKSLS